MPDEARVENATAERVVRENARFADKPRFAQLAVSKYKENF